MKFARSTRALVLVAISVLAFLLPATTAIAEPSIKLLNPSGYSTTGLRISTKQDANGDTSYHLVAWAGDVPANSIVEFEISPTPTVPGTGSDPAALATVEGTKVGDDTFHGFLSTTTVPDGQYFLRAILYGGFVGPGTGEEVARDEKTVTVQSSEPAGLNTVEMAYPSNGGPLGFWRAGGRPGIAVINGFASSGTNQVRALYTTTNPGNDPTWQACGSGAVSEGTFRVRCTLADEDSPLAVKAVAAVANQTPSATPAHAGADQTGDAHRVAPYAQNPTDVAIDPSSFSADPNKCTALVATVLDQSGIPVAGLNVDVHAQGPDDQLRFATQALDASPQHTNFQAPDAAHSGNELTAKCGQTAPAGRQGDHNVPGGPDQKHIEAVPTGGTNNRGAFTFFLLSATRGGTIVTAWGDENDDDSVNSGEGVGSAQIGWGEAPPAPATVLTVDPSSATAEVGECLRLEAKASQNGSGQSDKNVDVHITNPASVSFCNPGDSSASPPDGGGHAGDIDTSPENTRHAEGTTNSGGDFIFGVMSAAAGTTNVTAWLDDNNNDTQDPNETLTAATIDWTSDESRSISIRSNKRRVRKGRQVTLSGRIQGSDACTDNQTVKIQAQQRAGGYRTIERVTSDDSGEYSAKVRVRRTKRYRARAPKNGPCPKATSNSVRVRAR